MKLERRFRWDDLESIYKAVDEDLCEKATEGRIRFFAVRTDGRNFCGVGYASTISDMVDTPTGFWKLIPNPKGKGNVVYACNAPPLDDKPKTSRRASEKDASQ